MQEYFSLKNNLEYSASLYIMSKLSALAGCVMISVSVKKGYLSGKKLFMSFSSLHDNLSDDFIISNSFYFRFLFSPPTEEMSDEDIEFKKITDKDVGEYCLSEGKFISFDETAYSKNGMNRSQAMLVRFSKELVHYDVLEFVRNVVFEFRCENEFPELRPLYAGFYSGKRFFGESDSTGLDSDGFINTL